MMKNKFDFYDIVKVNSDKLSLQEINGFEGVIRGMSQNEDTGEWGYAVSIYKDNGLLWDIMEADLIATGKKSKESDFMTGESVKVRVDPKTGEGEIVDDD